MRLTGHHSQNLTGKIKNWRLYTVAAQKWECGHTFVYSVEFSHTLSPSGLTGNKLVKFLIDRLKPEERQFALDLLSGQTT
ncbi:phage protein [Escherichia coli]|uniref:Phage protein n=1 Tax=Escherichia coli TaxID=562 RepID=A0A2X3JKM9_ECOLX|nr:phage protein [Escherichia coli]